MGVAAYNRGSRVVSQGVVDKARAAVQREEMRAREDELTRLRAQVDALGHNLKRARRCLAAERLARAALRERLDRSESEYTFAVRCLCRLAFGAKGALMSSACANPQEGIDSRRDGAFTSEVAQ